MEQKSGKRTKGNVDSIDIIEVCSQPRVTLAAEKIGGVRPGASLHITTQDEDGRKWDFSELEMRNRAVRKILNEKPLVLVTSPVCADWISETDASCVKRGIKEKRRRVDQSAMHLNFVCNLHMLQHQAGRYFIHEQPRSATSWEASCVREVQCKTGAFTTNVDHCMYGLTRKIGIEDLPVRRATTLMSNMPAVRAILKDRCDGQHRHAALNNGHPIDQLDEHSAVLCAVIVRVQPAMAV